LPAFVEYPSGERLVNLGRLPYTQLQTDLVACSQLGNSKGRDYYVEAVARQDKGQFQVMKEARQPANQRSARSTRLSSSRNSCALALVDSFQYLEAERAFAEIAASKLQCAMPDGGWR